MKYRTDEDRYIRTTNFSLAIFLFAKGGEISGVNSLDHGIKEIVFNRTDKLDELIFLYENYAYDVKREDFSISYPMVEWARKFLLEKIKDRK